MALKDIDKLEDYEKHYAELSRPETKSFAVVFDAKEASCAINVATDELSTILQGRHKDSEKQPCLWFNLWGWDPYHEGLLKVLAGHYEISPRLVHVLCPKPNRATKTRRMDPVTNAQNTDLSEKASISSSSNTTSPGRAQPKRQMPTDIADIANDLWHFCSVDFGRRYVCICWNALFFFPENSTQPSIGKPNATRVWSSLLLCDDGTVISTFESPSGLSPKAITGIRNNQLNVFTHLSKYGSFHSNDNALMQISIRPFRSSEDSASSNNDSDMASLLFYYLFDDWLNIYYQAVGAENSYRNQLESLRQKMIDSAEVNQVTTLHRIGRELSVLKAVYRSYQSIIERIVQKHRRSIMLANPQYWNGTVMARTKSFGSGSTTESNEPSDSPNLVAKTAITRFERLLDRIGLCALTEVDECLIEKDDLVQMNFNLVSLKESQAVEKLTRVTVLLAKVTILFLPVSLTTGYFSMQFKQIDDLYSLKTYWLTFLVVGILTIIFLLGFGALSDRYQGKIEFMSLTKIFLKRRKRKRKDEA